MKRLLNSVFQFKLLFFWLFGALKKGLAFLCLSAIAIFLLWHTSVGQRHLLVAMEKILTAHLGLPVSMQSLQLGAEQIEARHISIALPSGQVVLAEKFFLKGSLLGCFLWDGKLEGMLSGISCGDSLTMQLPFKMHVQGESLTWQGALLDEATAASLATGEGSCSLERRFGFALCADKPIYAEIQAHFPLAPYLSWCFSNTVFVNGQAEARCLITGVCRHPDVQVLGKITQGYWESLTLGTVLDRLEADWILDGSQLRVLALTASDSFGGSLTGQGAVSLQGNLPFDFQLNLAQVTLLNTDDAVGAFSGELRFIGDRQQASLKGISQADKLTIFLPEQPAQKLQTVHVRYINQEEGQELPRISFEQESRLHFDLHVELGSNLLICGNGLTSQWKGDLRLIGHGDKPLIAGEMHLVNGHYLFGGKKWELTAGSLLLNEIQENSAFYISAQQTIGSLLVDVIVKGSLGDLSIAFRSSPALSQREILSYILFGRPLRAITPFQGSELSQSMLRLQSASKEGSDVLGRIKNALGFIDRIDLVPGDSDQAGDFSLKVGSYILPRLFVGLKKNFTSHANGIEIEADILPNIKLQAELNDGNERQIHLKWKKDY